MGSLQMKDSNREAFEKVFPCSVGTVLNEYGHYESQINQQDAMIQNIRWAVWQAAKASAKSEFNNFIMEYKKTLIKTYEDDNDNAHDYWRGFAGCAKSSEIILNAMIEAQEQAND